MILFRLAFIALAVLPFALVGMPFQALILAFRLPGWTLLPHAFFKMFAFGLGLRVRVVGAPVTDRPVLLVANHISWLDIPAIASRIPVSFVAKSEVAQWPLVGLLARMHRTIFVNRTRRTDTRRTANAITRRIEEGGTVLLFAEGTSDIGTHVLPFRSALLGAAQAAMTPKGGGTVAIQPMAIAYTARAGLPIARHERTQLAWVGDMGILDNLFEILSSGPKDVTIAFADPIGGEGERKTIAKMAEREVRRMLVAANRGQPLH